MCNPCESSNSGSDRDGLGINTLIIRPLTGELKHYEILSHFSAFGDVNNVGIYNNQKYSYELVNNVRIFNEMKCSYGYVEFALAESAAKALEVASHIIAGRRVKVAAASDRHQDGTCCLHQNDDDTTSLLDLNDDCILEILSMKCLSVVDLCSVAETCRRLKELSSRAFKREPKSYIISSDTEGNDEQAQRILMHFGSMTSDLKICGEGYSDERSRRTLDSVIEHCNNSLQSLELQKFIVPDTFTAQLGPVFTNLQKLRVESCLFEGASKELFADCGSLVELEIRGCRDVAPFILEKTFPKLQRFDFYCKVASDLLDSFFSRHKKSLKIWVANVGIGPTFLSSIADCQRLEELRCKIDENATLDLSNLGRLRKLEIGYSGRSVSQQLRGLDNLQLLEHLSLRGSEIDSEFVRILSQLKRLRALEFWGCTALQNFYQIGNLSQLTTLRIESLDIVDLDIAFLVQRLSKLICLTISRAGVKLDLEMYLRMVDAVQRRPDQAKLKFQFVFPFGSHNDNLTHHFSRNAHLVEMIAVRCFF